MTTPLDSEPWRGLPPAVADLIEPELGEIAGEILAAIAREVPEYARPLEGSFGRGLRTGVVEALSQFVALVRDPDAGRGPGRDVYVQLGRGEQRVGRTLDSLQSAYRIGARVAWRRIAALGRAANLPADALSLLAEAMFAYIDELSADSVEGYAEARAEVEDARRRRRRELARLLVGERPPQPADLKALAAAARWTPPAQVAALACAEQDLDAIARRAPEDALVAVVDNTGCLLLPDPTGPARLDPLRKAAASTPLVLGPTVEPPQAAESWTLARALLATISEEIQPELQRVDDHLPHLLLARTTDLTARIAAHRLAAFKDLTPRSQQRLKSTALAYIKHRGNAVAMSTELHVHPQTARYRIARLRELLGDQLDDPDTRFELELALRAGASLAADAPTSNE